MTCTTILLIYRKPSLSFTDFKHLYETSHVPLVQSLTGPLYPLSQKRTYISEPERPPTIEYDAITEMTFRDKAHYTEFSTKLMEGENGKIVAEDCDKFLDAGRTTVLVVESVEETLGGK